MGLLGELLATAHRQALEFFVLRRQDVSGPTVDRQELLYNASVLAHYAQISTQSDVELSAPASRSAVFEHFVLDTRTIGGHVALLDAASHVLARRHPPPRVGPRSRRL